MVNEQQNCTEHEKHFLHTVCSCPLLSKQLASRHLFSAHCSFVAWKVNESVWLLDTVARRRLDVVRFKEVPR